MFCMRASLYPTMNEPCQLCPHRCGVRRGLGELGCCQAGTEPRVGRAALHEWEEPPISGTQGSGTVFFGHCSLRCVYCQNSVLSRGEVGETISIEELAVEFCRLQKLGAHNINLVTPTHYVPQIIEALKVARNEGLHLPIVYNTSGYELPETIELLDGFVDIFLTDFKYKDETIAQTWSNAPGYYEHALIALDAMVGLVGKVSFDEAGIMQRGVLVRHLLLPGMLSDSYDIVKELHNRYGSLITLSLMGQYTPCRIIKKFPLLNEKVSHSDYESLLNYADALGVENYFWQTEGAAQESFIPDFSGFRKRGIT